MKRRQQENVSNERNKLRNEMTSNIEIVRTIQKRYELIHLYQDNGLKNSVLYNMSNYVNAIDKNHRIAHTIGIYASLTTDFCKNYWISIHI